MAFTNCEQYDGKEKKATEEMPTYEGEASYQEKAEIGPGSTEYQIGGNLYFVAILVTFNYRF